MEGGDLGDIIFEGGSIFQTVKHYYYLLKVGWLVHNDGFIQVGGVAESELNYELVLFVSPSSPIES